MHFYYEETIYFSIWYAWIHLQIRKLKRKALSFETIKFWFIGFYRMLFEEKMLYFYIMWKVEDPIYVILDGFDFSFSCIFS